MIVPHGDEVEVTMFIDFIEPNPLMRSVSNPIEIAAL